MEVRVEAVDDAEPGVVDVAVDVVGEQDGRNGEGREERDDRGPERPRPQSRSEDQHAEVGEEAEPDQGEGGPGADGQALAAFPVAGLGRGALADARPAP